MLVPDKSRPFVVLSVFSFGDSALLWNVSESRGGIGASERERGDRLHIV